MNFTKGSLLIALLPCISGCGALYWRLHASDPIQGVVVDAMTREPVKGVDVKVVWEIERPRILHGHDYERFEQRAVTGADGSFRVPGWGPKLINGHISANYPEVTITRPGNVQTTHENAWAGFGNGTVCNDQFTTDTTEWWHDSVVVNVTWNGCTLLAYADKESLAAAQRLARIESLTVFAHGTFPNPFHGYLGLFGDFISAKNIAQLPSEAHLVRAAFCEKLIDTYGKLTDAERASAAKYHGGSPAVPIEHETYVLPYCTAAEEEQDVPPTSPAEAF